MLKKSYFCYIIPAVGPIALRQFEESPDLKFLQKSVGGYIEIIPSFNYYDGYSNVMAYCNEDGISMGLMHNERATAAWRHCLQPGSYDPSFVRLLGDIVLYGKYGKLNNEKLRD